MRAEGGDKHRPSEGGVAELSLHCAATLAPRGTTRHPYLLVPGAAVLEPRPHTLSTSPFRGGESSALADMWRRPLGEARGGQEDRRGVRARTLLRRADVDTHSCGNNICVSERV